METIQPNTIHHGNCFDLLPLLPDASVDAIITDPPYGVLKGHKIETNVDIPRFFAECKRVMKPNAFMCFFGQMPTLLEWCNCAGEVFTYSYHIIWAKRAVTAIAQPILRTHESIVIYKKGKPSYCKTKGGYEDVKVPLVEIGVLSQDAIDNNNHALEMQAQGKNINRGSGQKADKYHNYMECGNDYPRGVSECNFTNLWSFLPHNRDNIGKGIPHPTVKPILLLERLVELLTPEPTADFVPLVLDPFAGSGTTAVACQNLNRNFIAIELHEEYVTIARKRLKESFNLFTDDAFRTE